MQKTQIHELTDSQIHRFTKTYSIQPKT